MKKIISLILLALLVGCTQDQQNQFSRKVMEFIDGNYLVTFANGPTVKTWTINNGKVTTAIKGIITFGIIKNTMFKYPLKIL
jgi:hypothetical protein